MQRLIAIGFVLLAILTIVGCESTGSGGFAK
ncbi:hypothetical protein BH09VER1_BH09VER1_43830 [soil metagenome]